MDHAAFQPAAEELSRTVASLGGSTPRLAVDQLSAGYGRTEIVHAIDLRVAPAQCLCLVGPNGAGKSTVLNAVFGFADVFAGRVEFDGEDMTRLLPERKLGRGIGYVLQESSTFPDLSVEDNLALGGYLMRGRARVAQAVERVFEHYPRLAERRRQPARVLSGGERRMLEIARALMLEPRLLLVDEPTIGLEPRAVEEVFATLQALKERDGVAILMVEQNAKRALRFADVGYVLVGGRVAHAAAARELLDDPRVGRLFLGGTP